MLEVQNITVTLAPTGGHFGHERDARASWGGYTINISCDLDGTIYELPKH